MEEFDKVLKRGEAFLVIQTRRQGRGRLTFVPKRSLKTDHDFSVHRSIIRLRRALDFLSQVRREANLHTNNRSTNGTRTKPFGAARGQSQDLPLEVDFRPSEPMNFGLAR
jgi:hypothetical protein